VTVEASSPSRVSDAISSARTVCAVSAEVISRCDKRSFYRRHGKRAFDFVTSCLALLLLSPFLILIAILVKLTSPGGAIYWQERVGRDGRLFRMAKFRSMVANAEQNGRAITAAGDARVTPVGAILRKLKIDEVPQLWNVVRGEMSLVGPRPELPLYVATYTPVEREVLNVAPGITDFASIAYRHEERILSASADPEALYRRVVLPHKLVLNLEYIERMGFRVDVQLIFKTLTSVFT
jgi:lipopolysaccharide/colanic/teichoic acid biosynthesis glycosyltransferase